MMCFISKKSLTTPLLLRRVSLHAPNQTSKRIRCSVGMGEAEGLRLDLEKWVRGGCVLIISRFAC